MESPAVSAPVVLESEGGVAQILPRGGLMSPIRLVHITKFRSTRPVWLYHELKEIYGQSALPPLEVASFADIPGFRKNKPQWLLEMNPNGKVPCMAHNDIVMFEGGAICSYFLELFDVNRILLPRDPKAVSLYYQLVSWCASTLDNLVATSSPINIILDPDRPSRPMDDIVTNKKYFDEIEAPYLTKILRSAKGPYMCGANFTAADVIIGFHLIVGARDKMQPTWITREVYPEIFDYVECLRSRSAFILATSPV
jgi:glutathione S-transferase